MKITDIRKLIDGGETITVEFKESKTELNKDVFESVCGMLNRLGGHLLLGIKDNGDIVGVDPSCVDKIKKNFVTSINNPDKISPTFYTNIEQFEIDGKVVLYAFIPTTPDVHRLSGRIFDRNEDGDFEITKNTNLVAQMYTRKTNAYTELKIFPYASIEELDKETFSKVRKMAHNQVQREHPWETMSDLELLKSAGLYRRDIVTGEEGLTLAAILLLGTEQLIMSALPHYKTDAIVRKKNIDRYDDRVVIQDNLIKSYNKLMDFVVKHLDDRFYIEGTQRIDVRNKIFREVCANMLIHREFSSAFPAKFIIEKDVVRTENANKTNGYGVIDALNFSPYPKNPMIAKFFREIGLADELGSGVKNVTQYLKVYSGGIPEFIEADIFKQVLPISEKGENTPVSTLVDTPVNTPDSKEKSIVAFCSAPKSKAEIAEHIGLTDLKYLKRAYLSPMVKKGLLQLTIPEKPTSRNQKYVTKK